MDKSNCKKDDNVVIEEVAKEDFSADSKENKDRNNDAFGYKETFQAGDTIKYTKSNGIAGRK
eukprot:13393003-Ditylum_brightwellii.AAC.1